jgi:hypothetical protein
LLTLHVAGGPSQATGTQVSLLGGHPSPFRPITSEDVGCDDSSVPAPASGLLPPLGPYTLSDKPADMEEVWWLRLMDLREARLELELVSCWEWVRARMRMATVPLQYSPIAI